MGQRGTYYESSLCAFLGNKCKRILISTGTRLLFTKAPEIAKKWLFTIYSKNKFSQRKRVSVTVAGEGHVVGTHRDLCHKELGGVLTDEV